MQLPVFVLSHKEHDEISGYVCVGVGWGGSPTCKHHQNVSSCALFLSQKLHLAGYSCYCCCHLCMQLPNMATREEL